MNLPFESVNVTTPDTIFTPYDDGSVSSRSTFVVGNAVVEACRDLKNKLFRAAAERLQPKDARDFELSQDRITVKSTGEHLP